MVSVLFLVELVASIIVFALGDQIIDDVIDKAKHQDEWNQYKDHLMIVNYFVIGTIVVEFLLILLTKCYIGSLKEKNSAYDYKPVDSEGNKISLQEKQQKDEQKIHEKYSKKRE